MCWQILWCLFKALSARKVYFAAQWNSRSREIDELTFTHEFQKSPNLTWRSDEREHQKLFAQRLLFYRRRFSAEDRLIHNGKDGLNIPRRNKCLLFRRKLSPSRNHVSRWNTQSEMMERIINSIKRLFKCNRKMFSNRSAGKFLLLLKATILNTVADWVKKQFIWNLLQPRQRDLEEIDLKFNYAANPSNKGLRFPFS